MTVRQMIKHTEGMTCIRQTCDTLQMHNIGTIVDDSCVKQHDTSAHDVMYTEAQNIGRGIILYISLV